MNEVSSVTLRHCALSARTLPFLDVLPRFDDNPIPVLVVPISIVVLVCSFRFQSNICSFIESPNTIRQLYKYYA
jgi:hypothetical protein